MLAIVEILANISAFGERAEDFRKILNDAGVLEASLLLLKSLKSTTEIMIEHKIYEPEEKFSTYASKSR
jgi:hypothetical protein